MSKRLLILLSFFCLTKINLAQQKIPNMKGWRVHMPYYKNNSLIESNGNIWVASQSGLFKFDMNTHEINRISKINGLADVEIRLIRTNESINKSIVLYESALIDIIDHKTQTITHLPQIAEQVMIGTKQINNICFSGPLAYLACSFGVVIIDMENKRIIDSYQNIGPNGIPLSVSDVEIFNDVIYLATPSGLFFASIHSPNLSDYNYWNKNTSINSANQLCKFNNNLYLFADQSLQLSSDGQHYSDFSSEDTSTHLRSLEVSKQSLIACYDTYVIQIQPAQNPIFHYNWSYCNQVIEGSDNRFYFVDDFYGLRIFPGSGAEYDYIIPDGPQAKSAFKMDYSFGKLWIASGSVNDLWERQYNPNLFYSFSNNTWKNVYTQHLDDWKNIGDIVCVGSNPINGRTFAASQGNGLFEINPENFHVISNFNDKVKPPSGYTDLDVSSFGFDANGNMWVANHLADKPILVMTPQGTWNSFSIGNVLNGFNRVCRVQCDMDNNKWFTVVGNAGLLVYNDNGTPLVSGDDQFKLLNKDEGNGRLPSNTVNCAIPDLNGEVWIGTDQGLAILSNPSLIFDKSKSVNFDAHQIVIKTGLVYSNFLGTEAINCIKVDGANRKWIGTPNGVWLVSPDGYTVIQNFTTKNSPLLSNNVYEIGIDESSGEVFFATDNGIISFMGDATKSTDDFNEVLIYPNPVRPNFNSNITIRGLANDCNVKIMDMGGRLVYETTSNGGTATWDGNTFSGKRAATGVYLIMASTRDGSLAYSGKIVFIN